MCARVVCVLCGSVGVGARAYQRACGVRGVWLCVGCVAVCWVCLRVCGCVRVRACFVCLVAVSLRWVLDFHGYSFNFHHLFLVCPFDHGRRSAHHGHYSCKVF